MTKKEITDRIKEKITAGEDRPRAIAAEILHEYHERMLPVIEAEAALMLKKAAKAKEAEED